MVSESEEPGFSFQDKRRVDPDTFEVREQPAAPEPEGNDEFAEIIEGLVVEGDFDLVEDKIAELTGDLQRVHAEYANYRKRVERDRESMRDLALGSALAEFLPVLDDIGRAREHGDLEGAFKSVAEALESTVGRLGFERFGAVGDPFDPSLHEAISHTESDQVTEPTCVSVFSPGYRYAGRVLRAAIVAVEGPE
ncbi:MAG: nucleotide exchange factor GrpE [Actinobacteria bacterium]|nr:nucleotide exchange factor GrpE [Actinomycetota bacterium]MSW36043.1 nucleotide exchange factor GrpE [Actinomycetota bacterium]MSX37943.1 nucleotide exchange factor GrpE [Actinomycetota bacterium]